MEKDRYQSILMLLLLSVIWGSSFILMKKGLVVYSPVVVASLRILIAGLIFFPIFLKRILYIPRDRLKYILIFALCEVGIPPFLYTFAQTEVDSSTAGILNSLVPLFTLIVGLLAFGIRFQLKSLMGVLIGLGGAFIMVVSNPDGGVKIDLSQWHGLLIVLSTLLYGIGGNVLKKHLQKVSSVSMTATAFVSMSLPALGLILSSNFFDIPLSEPQNLKAFGAIVILSSIGSALAIVVFGKLIQKSNALFGSFVTYLIPFVALIWGLLDGEIIGLPHIAGLGLILIGITISNRKSH